MTLPLHQVSPDQPPSFQYNGNTVTSGYDAGRPVYEINGTKNLFTDAPDGLTAAYLKVRHEHALAALNDAPLALFSLGFDTEEADGSLLILRTPTELLFLTGLLTDEAIKHHGGFMALAWAAQIPVFDIGGFSVDLDPDEDGWDLVELASQLSEVEYFEGRTLRKADFRDPYPA